MQTLKLSKRRVRLITRLAAYDKGRLVQILKLSKRRVRTAPELEALLSIFGICFRTLECSAAAAARNAIYYKLRKKHKFS